MIEGIDYIKARVCDLREGHIFKFSLFDIFPHYVVKYNERLYLLGEYDYTRKNYWRGRLLNKSQQYVYLLGSY